MRIRFGRRGQRIMHLMHHFAKLSRHGDWNLDGSTDLPDALRLRATLLSAGPDIPLEQLVPSLLENGGFESPDLDVVNGGNAINNGWNSIPAWDSDGNSVNSGIRPDGPPAAGIPEGSQVAFLTSNDPSIFQTTDHVIRAGDEFTLQFAAASYSTSVTLEASIVYFDGANRTVMETVTLTQSDATNPLSRTGWNVYSLTASAGDMPTAMGNMIGVEFNSRNGVPALDGVVLWLSAFGVSGDFDQNGVYECADVDALVAEIAGGTNQAAFDLTGDGLVDVADLTAWLSEAGETNLGAGLAYLAGDANLDGVVDVPDFNRWNSGKFSTGGGWCGGDFNADGATDVSDFNIWNANKFQSSADIANVPEPAASLLLIGAFIVFGARSRT